MKKSLHFYGLVVVSAGGGGIASPHHTLVGSRLAVEITMAIWSTILCLFWIILH